MLGLVGAARDGRRSPGRAAGRTEVTTETRALSLVFAVDISRSMLAEDVAPSRLQRAVREARRLVQDLEGDRLGLIAFAGQSYILAPLTVDGGAVGMYLDALDPDIASEGGTNLARGAAQGAELLGADHRRGGPGAGASSPTARRTTRSPRSCAQAEALKEAGVRLILVAEGGADAGPDSDPRLGRRAARVQAGRRTAR